MTTNTLSPLPKLRFTDSNNSALVSGKLFTYQAASTTKLTTYTDSTGSTPNSNPIILDYRGECNCWIPPNTAYKFTLAPSTDTDPPTNPIWTVDNLINSQLITLYGGVDTGIANAYILTFVANFTSYIDGTVIYWIPSHTNTTASSININGLGIVNITNQDGTALSSGQLQANQTAVIMMKSGAFLLLSSGNVPLSGIFNGILTGLAAAAVVVTYQINGKICTLTGAQNGTSSSTAMTMTGLPSVVVPTSGGRIVSAILLDNGINVGGWAQVTTANTIVFGTGINNNMTGFTAAGTKGLPAGWSIVYPLG
jgi:hypothetical protein